MSLIADSMRGGLPVQRTRTLAGTRLLRANLLQPLTDIDTLNMR